MARGLLSVGLDVGTTSTQMIVSRLTVSNQASAFSVPKMEIADRQVLWASPIHLTPLKEGLLVDEEALRELIREDYRSAGITREQVDTGAVIVTGETSRRENAAAVTRALAEQAGNFVVATAGPDLESILAARGAGAVAYSEQSGKTVLHLDIGGGTSNLALIRAGEIIKTGCLDVGGRLLKFDPGGTVTYVSPVLLPLTPLRPGDAVTKERLVPLCEELAGALAAAAGLGGEVRLVTREGREAGFPWAPAEELSFSGGVADCMEAARPWDNFGDIGPLLGQAIRRSALCQMPYRLGEQTIRATVIGAGCHSAQLSGSTVTVRNFPGPLQNLQAVPVRTDASAAEIRQALSRTEGAAVLALEGYASPHYEQVLALARRIAEGMEQRPIYVALQQDMAKALGQALTLLVPKNRPLVCLDGIVLPEGSFLDVGAPVGPALPVVVKTLIFSS